MERAPALAHTSTGAIERRHGSAEVVQEEVGAVLAALSHDDPARG
jgi:hypothetical protein